MAPRQRQEAKSEASVSAILDAALTLFSTQGYRATTLRQIAERSGVSVGNIYHHFPNKHAVYTRLIRRYWERLSDPKLGINKVFGEGRFPDDLEALAQGAEEVVDDNAEHILLIYVDVIEFRGEHIREFYKGMAKRFEDVYGEHFRERKARGEFGDVDPMVAVMVAARWLLYFFTVEKCFGAPLHFGMTPKQAVDEFIKLIRYGLLARNDSGAKGPQPNRGAATSKAKAQAAKRTPTAGGGKR